MTRKHNDENTKAGRIKTADQINNQNPGSFFEKKTDKLPSNLSKIFKKEEQVT